MQSAADARSAVLELVPSDEERMMRDTVGAICSGFGPTYSRRKHSEGLPPTELWDALAEKGYLGVNIPEEWGGGGLGMSALAAVGEEISTAGCSLLLIVVSPAIVGSILSRHGTPEQKDRWLRGIAAGTTKVAFAITEPDAGTNSHNLADRARAPTASASCCAARRPTSRASSTPTPCSWWRAAGCRTASSGCRSLCLVDVDAPGFTREAIPMPYIGPDKQWTLFFDDVELEEDRLIGGEGGGLGPVFDGLNPERIMGAAIAAGAGRRALAKAAAYAQRALRLGRADRHAPGRRPPAGRGEDRARAGAAHDPEGRRALRRRRARRGRGEQHGQVRGRRGGDRTASTRRSRPTAATASRSSTG